MERDGTASSIRILGFEAWDGGSHKAVREAFEQHSELYLCRRTLPTAHWRWRLRMGAADLVGAAVGEGRGEPEMRTQPRRT